MYLHGLHEFNLYLLGCPCWISMRTTKRFLSDIWYNMNIKSFLLKYNLLEINTKWWKRQTKVYPPQVWFTSPEYSCKASTNTGHPTLIGIFCKYRNKFIYSNQWYIVASAKSTPTYITCGNKFLWVNSWRFLKPKNILSLFYLKACLCSQCHISHL